MSSPPPPLNRPLSVFFFKNFHSLSHNEFSLEELSMLAEALTNCPNLRVLTYVLNNRHAAYVATYVV